MGDVLKQAYADVNNSYKKLYEQKKNPYLHHIHVKCGNEIHTLSHFNDCVEIDELLSVIKEIIDEEAKRRA